MDEELEEDVDEDVEELIAEDFQEGMEEEDDKTSDEPEGLCEACLYQLGTSSLSMLACILAW